MAIFAWNIPFFWEATFFGEGGHHGGPINWGIGFLAILLTGIALYPWCYATLFLFWSFFGKPNARRTGETIGGIHLTHFGLIWFWLALITIKNGNLFADNENKNMYAAIDEVIIKLDRQLRKQKEKIIDRR